MAQITSLNLLDVYRFESPEILKKLALSSRCLAALNVKAGSDRKHKSTYGYKAHINVDEEGLMKANS